MLKTYSPLEHLAAFAIVFVTGVISATAVCAYIDEIRRDAQEGASAGH
jgi:hypothetical protein